MLFKILFYMLFLFFSILLFIRVIRSFILFIIYVLILLILQQALARKNQIRSVKKLLFVVCKRLNWLSFKRMFSSLD